MEYFSLAGFVQTGHKLFRIIREDLQRGGKDRYQ
jgi:hypothetical protein